MNRRIIALLCAALLMVCACRRDTTPKPVTDTKARAPGSDMIGHVTGLSLGDDIYVGAASHYGNLTVFPILAKTQKDPGPMISLHEGLDKGTVEVRELPDGDVAVLVVENKGDVRVYALAGTIVKGGKQDRQIGQDFVIGAKETVNIDAFCVEHGRWNGVRQGEVTGGKFTAVGQLATRPIRVAGQYKGDQSQVWSKVSEENRANGKTSNTDSYTASTDDGALTAKRDKLARRILADLAKVSPPRAVVGYAYAIGGEVKGVRWFAHHRVFVMFRQLLINTVAAESITAAAMGIGKAKTTPSAQAVAEFLDNVRNPASAPKRRATDADNVNEYAKGGKVHGSKTVVEADGAPSADPAAPAAKPKPVDLHFDAAVE